MYKWQIDLLDKMTKYQGRGFVMTTGRQLGKSAFSAQAVQRMINDLYNRPVEELILTEQPVHGARYYCVQPVRFLVGNGSMGAIYLRRTRRHVGKQRLVLARICTLATEQS
jgi:hypothetical protein